ncbi:MAG: ferrochelatase [Proteobacteria bacterium]|nr:ferrochelatase [Pseudomonadota bacterium]
MKIAVILFNLGGPDAPEAVEPFLKNLFTDPAIISLPGFVRRPLGGFIAKRRGPIAREIYAKIGGRSPIVEETQLQADTLEAALKAKNHEARCFIAMRYWKPFAEDAARAAKTWGPDRVVLLPLYPQFSTTTTASSESDWNDAAGRAGLRAPTTRICCYPWESGFIASVAALIGAAFGQKRPGVDYRLLLSAHGLPKRTVMKGDPYPWQVEKTAAAIVDRLGIAGLDWQVCYQSRVGPLEWIGPATDAEIRRAGREGKGLIVAPIAFVSEHSETLVELDIEYGRLAREAGVADYIRVPAVGAHAAFIEGLAALVDRAALGEAVVTCGPGRICPKDFVRCGFGAVTP